MTGRVCKRVGTSVLTFLAAATWLSVGRAQDPTLTACIAANEGSIQRRTEHRLLAARASALECAVDACPKLLREACKRRVELVSAALPTIVLEARDASGAEVAVKLTMDGERQANWLSDTPITADPGEHKFVFEATGLPPIEKTFILREREKDRHERIVVANPNAVAPPTATVRQSVTAAGVAPLPEADTGTATRRSKQKVVAVVAGGVGVAGIAVGTVFGLLARSRWSSSQGECPSVSNCPQHAQAVSDRDTAERSATIATIAMIAGGAAIAGGAVLWVLAPRGESARRTTAVGLSPDVGPSNAGLLLQGVF